MNPTAATVFIVDDDASHRRATARLLRAGGFQVADFESAGAFLAHLAPDMAGCVVTDLRMPGLDGLGLQAALERAANPLPVIFLTGHGDIPTTVQAMRRGAEDFLTKTSPKEVLLDAIRRALELDARQRAAREQRNSVRRRLDSLTAREREIMDQVLQGKLNKQIAFDLGIHERTVKFHRTAATRKLGVRSVAELARLFQDAVPPAALATARDP